jgi:hypothetical protein
MTPPKVVEPAEPDVSVAIPSKTLTLVPVSDVAIEPTVSLFPARFSVVLSAIDTAESSGITPGAPEVRVPAEIVVDPL